MNAFCHWLDRLFGTAPKPPPVPPPVPQDIREASHKLRNATAVLLGTANALRRETHVLEQFLEQMQHRREQEEGDGRAHD